MNELIPLIVGGVMRWLVYAFLLWIMIRIQKIQCSGLGLLASSAAAVLTSFVPVVGVYASHGVLLLCLWKATRASIAPDLMFTVVIAGALMFCVDLWAMGSVMGELGFSQDDSTLVVEADEGEHAREESAADTSQAAGATEAKTSAKPEPPAQSEPTVQRMRVHPWGVKVKGIAYSVNRPLAMLQADNRIFTLRPGEGFTFPTREGRQQVRCLQITPSSVLLELNGKQRVELLLD